MGIRLKLDTIQAVVVATAVLHNKACDEKEKVPPINNNEEVAINIIKNVPVPNAEYGIVTINENNQMRHNLIYNYFANL